MTSEDINKALWNERAAVHAASSDYHVARFAEDPAFISDVVAFDRPLLGSVEGLRGVHVQCHIGTDTVSLARLGARMTGFDFSPEALAEARHLAASAGVDVEFVEGRVDDAPDILGRDAFDLVYTGIGALNWLPSIDRWAGVVAELLRPGGRLFMREGHPVMWALDDTRSDDLVIGHPYFEGDEPSVWDEPGTYVATNHEFTNYVSHEWNHGLGEIVTALLDHGMRLTTLVEHTSVPWQAIAQMAPIGGGEYRLVDHPERLPHTYTLGAIKPAD